MGVEAAVHAASKQAKSTPGEGGGLFRRKHKAPETKRQLEANIGEGQVGLSTKNREGLFVPENVDQQYQIFIRLHYKSLLLLEKRAPYIFDLPGHQYDKQLLDAFKGENGRFNEANLHTFLKSQEGMEITTVLMDHQLSLRDMTYGFVEGDRFFTWPGKRGRDLPKVDRSDQEWKFNALKNDKDEAMYVRFTTGVDVNDFEWDAKEKKVRYTKTAPPGGYQTTMDAKEFRQQTKEFREARNTYLHDVLHVPKRLLDASAEEWLLVGQPELNGLSLYSDVLDIFKNKYGGWRPGDAERRNNIENWNKARADGLTQRMEKQFETVGISSAAKDADARIKAVQAIADGAEKRKTTKQGEIETQIKVITVDRTERLGEVGSEKGMQKPFTDLEKQLAELDEKRVAAIKAGAAEGSIDSIDRRIAALQDDIRGIDSSTGKYKTGSVLADREAVMAFVEKGVETEVAGLDVRLFPSGSKNLAEKVDAIKASWLDRYQPQLGPIAEREKALMDKIKELQQARTAIQDAELQFLQTKDNPYARASESMRTMEASYATITGFGIGAADLRTKSVGGLMQQENKAHKPGKGTWPEALNGEPAQRSEMLRAMTQAHVGGIMDGYDKSEATKGNKKHLTTMTSSAYGVSEAQLIILSLADIKADLVARGITLPADAFIQGAQDRARRQLSAYAEAMKAVDKTLSDEIHQRTVEKVSVDFSSDADKAKMMLEVAVDRIDAINEMGGKMVEQKAAYTDATLSAASTDPALTDAEKNADVPMGYLKAMNDWFGYQTPKDKAVTRKKADGSEETVMVPQTRAGAFRGVQRRMPPLKYAQLMNQHLGLGTIILPAKPTPAEKAAFITDVFSLVDAMIGTDIDAATIRRAQRGIWYDQMDQLRRDVES